MKIELILDDCIKAMAAMPDGSVDAIVCDPPYGIGFMGKGWDHSVPSVEWGKQCLRVLKDGGHLIAFASTRTVHRLTATVEDAGFDIRDQIGWVYFSGFPKSMDISKAIDRAAGAEREVIGQSKYANKGRVMSGSQCDVGSSHLSMVTAPATPAAKQWQGWGTALKPAIEPAVLARKPIKGTVANNVLKHGTGAINIDACRIAYGDPKWVGTSEKFKPTPRGTAPQPMSKGENSNDIVVAHANGRWPANLIAVPKPSRAERERGCAGLTAMTGAEATNKPASTVKNFHPTVKPVELMRWLTALVVPDGGTVLDPFMGSGTAGIAAILCGVNYIGIERDPDYFAIAEARVGHAKKYTGEWLNGASGERSEAERNGQCSMFTMEQDHE